MYSVKNTEELKICVDLFGQTKYDGKAISLILQDFQCFRMIQLFSDHCMSPSSESEINRYYINTQRIKD